jgi:hypothetical protein
MGGSGSGRTNGHTKVEDCRWLDASRWMKEGILQAGVWRSGSWQWKNADTAEITSSIGYEVNITDSSFPWLRLYYSFTQTKEALDYKIQLQPTRPYIGGLRWWFTCPLVINHSTCNRRVAKLYLPPGGRYFGCRHCYDLTYESCQKSHKFDGIFSLLARDCPGMTPFDVKNILTRKKT